MVPRFVRSGERIDVLQFLQGLVQMATDDVRRREGFPFPSAEEEARLSVANKLLKKSGNRRVEVNLTKAVRCLEPLFDPTVMNFLFDEDTTELSIQKPNILAVECQTDTYKSVIGKGEANMRSLRVLLNSADRSAARAIA